MLCKVEKEMWVVCVWRLELGQISIFGTLFSSNFFQKSSPRYRYIPCNNVFSIQSGVQLFLESSFIKCMRLFKISHL